MAQGLQGPSARLDRGSPVPKVLNIGLLLGVFKGSLSFLRSCRISSINSGSPFGANRWASLVDDAEPAGQPGIAVYVSTKTTKKDTYGPKHAGEHHIQTR